MCPTITVFPGWFILSPLGYSATTDVAKLCVDIFSNIGYSKFIFGIFIVPTVVNPLKVFFEPVLEFVPVFGVSSNPSNVVFVTSLLSVSVGDKVYITDYRGTSITYTIYNKFEASESDTSFYDRDTAGKAEITLSTCTDASNDQRTIIFAKQD